MNRISKIFLVTLCIIYGTSLNAQIGTPSCGSHKLMEYMDRNTTGFLDQSDDFMMQLIQVISHQSHERDDDDLYVIPVVFHVIYNNNNENIPDSVLFNQIEILNDCFRRHNADAINTRPEFHDIVGDSKIEFKLAEIDTNGLATNGITRMYSDVENFGGILPYSAGQVQEISDWVNDSLLYNIFRITQTSLGGENAWDPERYLNIWIGDLRIFEPQFNNFEELVYFGLATPPINHINWPDSIINAIDTLGGDGVIMHYVNIGGNNPNSFTGPYAGYNGLVTTGKMLVHEVGHYLGLRHIWGDGNCTHDDYISDTPNSDSNSGFGCNQNSNSCVDNIGGLDLHNMIENYMDYSDANCQNSFTIGQIEVMRTVLEINRVDLAEAFSTANTDDWSLLLTMNLYPNPNSGEFNIDLGTVYETVELSIFNSVGQLVANQYFRKTDLLTINLDLEKGIYFIRISSDTENNQLIKLIVN